MKKTRWIIGLLICLLLGLLGAFAFRPVPVLVELAEISRGPVTVTVNEDGRTRIKDKYIVSSPVSGRLRRLIFREGDPVTVTQTILASIEPSDPSLLDARTFAQTLAQVSAAEAAVERAQTRLEQARVESQRAANEFQRAEKLVGTSSVSQQELETLQAAFHSSLHAKRSAEFDQEIAQYELQMARAALTHVRQEPNFDPPETAVDHFNILSPIDGVILRIFQESSTIVTPGMPILEVGDPQDLEVVVDVRSEDAIRVQPGAKVFLEQWGGNHELRGVVRRIEPSAFERVSALGIEEQRVNVLIDFQNDSHHATNLGDGYRVEARIVVWQNEDTLRVPVGALFREQNQWAVFCNRNGRAELVRLEIGHRDSQFAEVLAGLREGDQVIIHPSDKIVNQSLIRGR